MRNERPVCAVVGAGPGVAYAVAKRFAVEGFAVVLLARRAESLEQMRAQLAADVPGAPVAIYTADAGDAIGLADALTKISRTQEAPSVLVYNAAALHEGKPSEMDADTLGADLRVNVVGALAAAKAVLPGMRERGAGTILFTGGGLALYPSAGYASLSIGKAGLRALALTLHEELKPEGIHVATVTIAGGVETGTHFDPELIAGEYWRLHAQSPPDSWEAEVVYR